MVSQTLYFTLVAIHQAKLSSKPKSVGCVTTREGWIINMNMIDNFFVFLGTAFIACLFLAIWSEHHIQYALSALIFLALCSSAKKVMETYAEVEDEEDPDVLKKRRENENYRS